MLNKFTTSWGDTSLEQTKLNIHFLLVSKYYVLGSTVLYQGFRPMRAIFLPCLCGFGLGPSGSVSFPLHCASRCFWLRASFKKQNSVQLLSPLVTPSLSLFFHLVKSHIPRLTTSSNQSFVLLLSDFFLQSLCFVCLVICGNYNSLNGQRRLETEGSYLSIYPFFSSLFRLFFLVCWK